jgi:4-hydroxy-3-polyprenylbenzoate decarboxylase
MSDPLKPPREKPRLVVGISGASGVVYGMRALDACRELGVESHLVVSKSAVLTLRRKPASFRRGGQ